MNEDMLSPNNIEEYRYAMLYCACKNCIRFICTVPGEKTIQVDAMVWNEGIRLIRNERRSKINTGCDE